MRRAIDVNFQSLRFQHRAAEGAGRALAVGAGDMDHRRQLALGMIELIEQPQDAVQHQIDLLGMKRQQPFEDRVATRRRGWPFTLGAGRRVDDGGGGDGRHRRAARLALHHQMDEPRQGLAQLVAMHDHVDHAVLGQIFGALESFRQFLADGLLDHARAGEADQRAGLGDLHVAQHRVGRGDAAGGRIGQHDDVGQPRLVQHVDADRDARHLHQREDAFLHARAAGGHEQNERPLLLDRGLHGAHQAFAHAHAERAAEEIERLHRDHHRHAVQRAARGGQRFLTRRLGARRFEFVGIFLLAAELERIGGDRRRRQFLELAGVEDGGEALRRADAHMEAALRADVLRRHEIAVEDHLAAARAFLPEIFRRVALAATAHQALDARTDEIGDPVHGSNLAQTSCAPHGRNRRARGRIQPHSRLARRAWRRR